MVDRDGKAERFGAVSELQRGDPNNPSVPVEERTAAVARVDRRVGLHERRGARRTDPADDSPRHRIFEQSQRKADRDHLLTHPSRRGRSQWQDRLAARSVDPEERQIEFRCQFRDACLHRGAGALQHHVPVSGDHVLVRDHDARRHEEAGATAGGALDRHDGGNGRADDILEWRRRPPNAGRLELTLGSRTSGIGATGGCSVGTVAWANRSGAAAAFASEVSSETALEEAPGRVVSDDDHWTASMTSKAMLIPLQIRAQGTRWRGGLTSAAWPAAGGDSSSASASYPQRHKTTLFGTRRLHAGQTHTKKPPVIFGDMPTCATTAH